MAMLTRWSEDTTRPSAGEAVKALLTRAVAPTVVVFAVIVGIGLLIGGPLEGMVNEESRINRALAAERDTTWNSVTMLMSHIGNTEYVIGLCLIVVAVVWWRTKEWWYAVVPLVAISLQASAFVAATALVGRSRPPVSKLDPAPPTSSFPSGHVGAATALYLTFALMAERIEHVWLRRVVQVVCVLVPFAVAYARLYRGMHHVTDVTVGFLNGLVCCLLAWHWLPRRARGESGRAGSRAADANAH